MRVQWQTPSDDYGAIDNYTLTLYHDEIIIEMLLIKSSPEKHGLFLSTIQLGFMVVTVLELETQVHSIFSKVRLRLCN